MTGSAPLHLSARAARLLLLAAQGLDRRPRRRARKPDVLAAIRRMGALQIDTIHVVARSPYLVLWSRLGPYEPGWLDALLAEGALFEYWAHEACFLPIEDYPLYRHRMLDPSGMGWKYSHEWVEEHREAVDRLLAHVRAHGPVRSADFERTDGQGGGWWGWKTEKRALEMLFTSGELMVARRHNFQRVYDLRERVLPSWDDAQLPSRDAVARTLALRAVHALGVTTARWAADYFRTPRRETAALVARLGAEGALVRAEVEGWQEPAYVHPERVELARRAADGGIRATHTTLLSPFDPVVWDRDRAKAIFDFDYRLECYTPAPKRRYGYFVLPILRRGALVGRLDAKAHRREGIFEVRALFLEPHTRVTDRLLADLAGALLGCAAWHGTPDVVIRRTEPGALADALRRALRGGGAACRMT
ncbi:MAG TPA: crosslink repair DNA glycosylase YcaQ family protein [Longimicrobiales bacterium]